MDNGHIVLYIILPCVSSHLLFEVAPVHTAKTRVDCYATHCTYILFIKRHKRSNKTNLPIILPALCWEQIEDQAETVAADCKVMFCFALELSGSGLLLLESNQMQGWMLKPLNGWNDWFTMLNSPSECCISPPASTIRHAESAGQRLPTAANGGGHNPETMGTGQLQMLWSVVSLVGQLKQDARYLTPKSPQNTK